MKAFLVALLIGAGMDTPPEDAAGVFVPSEPLGALLRDAGENSPEIQAAWHRWQAALQRVPQATSLEDPMLTLGGFLLSDVNRMKVGLSQKFPWFGTLRTRGDAAAARAEATLDELYAVRDGVFEKVKLAWFDLLWVEDQLGVIASQEDVLSYMQDVVTARVALGTSMDSDLLRVSIERTRLQDRRDSLRAQVPGLVARLNDAVGRPIDTAAPSELAAAFPPDPPRLEELRVLLSDHAPTLARLDHLLEADAHEVTLAEKAGRPDFTLGLDYTSVSKPRQVRPDRPYPASLNAANRTLSVLTGGMPFNARQAVLDAYALGTSREPMVYSEGGEDNLMVSVSVRVPIWRKRVKAAREEARQMEKSREQDREAERQALVAAAEQTAFALRDAKRRHLLYEASLLPQAQATFESLQTQYATGAMSAQFLDVLESVNDLLALALEQLDAARDRHRQGAILERILGTSWKGQTLTLEEASAEE
jgi:outer membrane protein TolC